MPSPGHTTSASVHARVNRFLARAWSSLLDVMYPPHCCGCGWKINAADVLCPCCMTGIIALPMTPDASRDHLASLSFPTDATMMFVGYEFEVEGAMAECIHALKYRGLHVIGIWLGRLLGERLHGTAMLDGDPVLVPVPLHRIKRIERGFNQTEVICRGIAKETGLAVIPDALVRNRYTDSQAAMQLDKSSRRGNMLNAFDLRASRRERIGSRPVILVDDLITTGATIGECASVLREHGVRDIRFVAVARPTSLAGHGLEA